METTTATTGFKRMGTAPKTLSVPAAQLQSTRATAQREAAPVLKEGAFKQALHWDTQYLIVLPVGWAFEECERPEFWAHVAHKLARKAAVNQPDQTGVVLNITTEDNNFRASLVVTAVREKTLEVKRFQEPVYFDLKEIPETDAYVSRWNPQARGWDVSRKSDSSVVATGLKTRSEAKAWMER